MSQQGKCTKLGHMVESKLLIGYKVSLPTLAPKTHIINELSQFTKKEVNQVGHTGANRSTTALIGIKLLFILFKSFVKI